MVQDIALALIQTVGLLMPVVFLSMAFFQRQKTERMDKQRESYFVLVFMMLISCLTISGFLLVVGLFDTALAGWIVALGLIFLMAFFILFGILIGFFIRSLDPELKRHW